MFKVLQRLEIKKPYTKVMQLYASGAPIAVIISEMVKHDILVLPICELIKITKKEMPNASNTEIECMVAVKVRYISKCYYKNYVFLQ